MFQDVSVRIEMTSSDREKEVEALVISEGNIRNIVTCITSSCELCSQDSIDKRSNDSRRVNVLFCIVYWDICKIITYELLI